MLRPEQPAASQPTASSSSRGPPSEARGSVRSCAAPVRGGLIRAIRVHVSPASVLSRIGRYVGYRSLPNPSHERNRFPLASQVIVGSQQARPNPSPSPRTSRAHVVPPSCETATKIPYPRWMFEAIYQRFGGRAEFAVASVLAHEMGHQVQDVLGILLETGERACCALRSINVELHADCLAGVWTYSLYDRDEIDREGGSGNCAEKRGRSERRWARKAEPDQRDDGGALHLPEDREPGYGDEKEEPIDGEGDRPEAGGRTGREGSADDSAN